MRCRIALVIASCLIACGTPASHPMDAPAACGNGMIDPGEACDDGAANGTAGDGCTAECAFACVDPVTDCPAAPACDVQTCSADHVCVPVADPTQDGAPCGAVDVCSGGACGMSVCGNGVVEPGEGCDFGSGNGPNTGCESDCTLSCTLSPDSCDDGNPCNGTESCGAVTVAGHPGQRCATTAPLVDGTSCGSGELCLSMACTVGVCGDGFVTSPEECDDANDVSGDGCDACKFTCVSTDPDRDCTPADACAGQGSCNDTTHVCAAGTALADDVACTGGYCQSAVCTEPSCGDGVVTPNESCDDGDANGAFNDGCTTHCAFACVNPATDCGPPPACEVETCTAAHTCHAVPDPTQDDDACGGTFVCHGGSCADPDATCGNGVVEPGEQCDFGTGNGPGTGCEIDCRFSCTTAPDSCDDHRACNGVETCEPVDVLGQLGQACAPGAAEPDGTSCGTARICLAKACTASVCGDGYIDTGHGESCEPPNTVTCDSTCHVVVCGDGVRAGTEQCDDGNTTNLDGCDATCKFEQVVRLTSISVPTTPDTYCTHNKLGGALYSVADTEINDALTSGIGDGSITVIFEALGLDDLTGTSAPSFRLGTLGGTPTTGTSSYDGSNDLDWWYTTDPTTIDDTRTATTIISASIAAKVLTAGPGHIAFKMSFDGVLVTMDELDTHLRANIGTASKPTASTSVTPGHLASEHLDPALESFTNLTAGELCGNTTARSLYNTHVPSMLVGNMCSQNYSTSNNLLDMYISGCHFILLDLVTATQPDAARTPGDAYVFAADASHVVSSCTKNGVADTLDDCLDNAAYSTFVKFTADRVISK